ncbi:hypothetical protein SporoP37_10425 [Sporosarcina sp. P37]|uniref:hypothetical protein n=1 Tax=unclassified Sporosarcina TaxID=2647733 RepID=UPI0009C06876|nr:MULTISPECIES: hypothetical protein [unclassified Sporosarcina]ARD48515.1 hypothetical protein SporoP33_10010 [Sporosarcina sp. P33]ARK25020.1 hypothetical protein SporoP37_10425 [Sporosarcina sp. P37]PID18166.1 hypothetical protein CSV62_09760 [Sporosarcina sp. P35]
MKKLLAIFITAAALAACSNEEPAAPAEPADETAPAEQSNEVEEGLKADTAEQKYTAFANDEVPVNSKVKYIGTISASSDNLYEIQNGTDEIIHVKDIRLGERADILEGSAVTVYGTYDGKNDEGVPVIKGIFIDEE